jgi:hypothetical protein
MAALGRAHAAETSGTVIQFYYSFVPSIYRILAEDHGRKPVGESVPLKQMKELVLCDMFLS